MQGMPTKLNLNYEVIIIESRDSSVGIVDSLQTGQRSRGSIPGRGKIFSLPHNVQTSSEAHPAYPIGIAGSFPGGKEVGA
jgi:hypothetical protein